MGKFVYDEIRNAVDIEDRALAHLRLVFMNKLRRNEPFIFDVPSQHGTSRRELWIHPSLTMYFSFVGSRPPQINTKWVEQMLAITSESGVLRLTPEPQS